MKKIVLIEDRYKRQDDFLESNGINLDDYEGILDNFTHHKADNVLVEIAQGSFNFENYDIIICHKSVENNTLVLSNLQNYCKKHHKTLVLFSGGISVNYYDNSEYELLELNSKTFYSQNIVLFLEAVKAQNENIMMLCYGDNWKLNIVSNILEKTNYLIGQVEDSEIFYDEFVDFVDMEKLSKIDHSFYAVEIQNSRTTIEEIKRFQESLLEYFVIYNTTQTKINKNIVIHHDNVIDIDFDNDIKFKSDNNIDKYISNYIIKELQDKEFDTIFIKDNLSSNYLELYGLRVAYHIRLSSELENKRFAPIVIISDFDKATLNRFTQEANILFTDGIYLCKNTKEDIEKYQSLELKGVSDYDMFLNKIEVAPPKDTSGTHDIANKWSIYRWGEFLGAKGDAIEKNRSEIENQLYFKYLKALYAKKSTEDKEPQKPVKKGKILLIDDEWDKGWGDILKKALDCTDIEFDSLDVDYKDKEWSDGSYTVLNILIKKYNPDVVVLDLRLAQADRENENIDNYTGIKILQKIHEINAGIQVIMLTATSKSTVLEKLYEYKILGYVKKEHPTDLSIDTIENIDKFVGLVDEGLNRKYLKDIWSIKKEMIKVLEENPFKNFINNENEYEEYLSILIKESEYVFKILHSDMENKMNYALVSIVTSIDAIHQVFIPNKIQGNYTFWDGSRVNFQNSLKERIKSILIQKLNLTEYSNIVDSLDNMTSKRNDYIHSNTEDVNVTSEEITQWYSTLSEILNLILHPKEKKERKKSAIRIVKRS